jgi:hypothetical protein
MRHKLGGHPPIGPQNREKRFPRSGDIGFTSLVGRSADSAVDQALIAFAVTKELCEDILRKREKERKQP